HLDAEAAGRLRALARREGATLFMVLLAGWQALLSRYSGQDDVSVGTPVAGRTRSETEGLIGFFVNTLVLRAELGGDPSFRALTGRVRAAALGAYAHQEVPFEKLVEELAPERSLTHTPLFQALFTLGMDGRTELRLGPVAAEPLEAGARPAKFDLALGMAEAGEGISGALQYRPELWDAATAGRMAAHLGTLFGAVAADPERPLGEIDLLSPGERRQLLEEWNATGEPFAEGVCLHHLVSAQARRTPDAVAVVHGGRETTYAELERRSDRLAHALRGRGVGPETCVGICTGRTPEMLVGMLGVLKAGGAYLPLDRSHPADRLRYVLEDAGVRTLLVRSAEGEAVPGWAGERICLDVELPEADGAPESGVGAGNLAYVIYTSGSTGRPKGVQVEHRGVVALLHWLRGHVRAEERESVLCSTSITFDVSVAEIFDTLSGGGRLVLVENALELASLTGADGVRLAYMVPGAAAELLRMGAIPPGLKTLNLAGEALPAGLAGALHAAGVERVANIYGPTEATVYATSTEVEPGAEQVTIGRPIA
ncbi:MAG TPA: AMP-binding protein, partial [Longimicrobiaceae bacterium]|nr:AMP-binding protein [Longimicrobiaceae bacterium]